MQQSENNHIHINHQRCGYCRDEFTLDESIKKVSGTDYHSSCWDEHNVPIITTSPNQKPSLEERTYAISGNFTDEEFNGLNGPCATRGDYLEARRRFNLKENRLSLQYFAAPFALGVFAAQMSDSPNSDAFVAMIAALTVGSSLSSNLVKETDTVGKLYRPSVALSCYALGVVAGKIVGGF